MCQGCTESGSGIYTRNLPKFLAGDSPERKLCQLSFAREPVDNASKVSMDTYWQWRVPVRDIFKISLGRLG